MSRWQVLPAPVCIILQVTFIQGIDAFETFVDVLGSGETRRPVILFVAWSQGVRVNFQNLDGVEHCLFYLILFLLHPVHLLLIFSVLLQLLGAVVVRKRNNVAWHLLIHRRALLSIFRRLVPRLE